MRNLAETFLTPQEQALVTEAVHSAEGKTSGEIVPMIVSASSDYRLSIAMGVLLIAVPVAFLCTELLTMWLWLTVTTGMALFTLLSIIFFLLLFQLISRMPLLAALRQRLLLPHEVAEMVHKSAVAAFYAESLYETQARNGILLYISVLEKKAFILADKGINARIDQSTWDSIMHELTAGIKRGERCAAICAAVTAIGNLLVEQFPVAADDVDELHDLIIRS